MDLKPTNPKDLIGTNKVPLNLNPSSAAVEQCLAHLEGNLKYGLVNWRESGVKTSIYVGAAMRHLMKFYDEGQWCDERTLVSHLGSVMACCAIIIDARYCGKLIDDRPKPGELNMIDEGAHVVEHLRRLFADADPIHYTIDGPVSASPSAPASPPPAEAPPPPEPAWL